MHKHAAKTTRESVTFPQATRWRFNVVTDQKPIQNIQTHAAQQMNFVFM